MSYSDLILRLFIQLAIILFFCRAISYIGNKFFSQTNVICEMVAGILLGPSFFGLLFPDLHSWIFPTTEYLLANHKTIPNPSMSILFSISQIGIVLYMFQVGLELDIKILKNQYKSAAFIASIGTCIPFLLGVVLFLYLPSQLNLFNESISDISKSIFLGTALSITALPILARILEEKNAVHTELGLIALSAGTLGDLLAWIIFAILLSGLKSNINIALLAILGTTSFIVVMLLIKKPLGKFFSVFDKIKLNSNATLGTILAGLMICSWFTDHAGTYSVFGAFIAGIIIPRARDLSIKIKQKLEHVTNSLLLPIFFVFSGLNTQINLINSIDLLGLLAVVLLTAILGKGLSTMFAAKITGINWRDSIGIGILMNTRGLMELIVLNIGLQQHIITHALFTILVTMAIITTMITSPLYNLLYKKEKKYIYY